jgi:CheY-specific phosphatase CheX
MSEQMLQIDPTLLHAVIKGTEQGLEMTGLKPPPVGATRFFSATRSISVIIGLVGGNNGTVTLNMSEGGMLHLAGKLIGETQVKLNEDNFDAISEIGNMVAGRIKELLAGTQYEMAHISVPSLVMGANYDVYYTRGITSVSVEFEMAEIPITEPKDRFFTTTVSLLRRVA